jgi:tRNA(adenine34) deaminase
MSDFEKEKFMLEALKEAGRAYQKNEIPIGAVIVKDGKVIAKGHNTREKSKRATSHAEILAINKACKKLKNWRLLDCDLYVTVEPCLMCLGALYNARIRKLYYGAENKSNGEVAIDYNATIQNHRIEVEGGVCGEEAKSLMSSFFKKQKS